jgi:hypothetical protein
MDPQLFSYYVKDLKMLLKLRQSIVDPEGNNTFLEIISFYISFLKR